MNDLGMYTALNKNQLMSRCIYLHSQFDGNKVTGAEQTFAYSTLKQLLFSNSLPRMRLARIEEHNGQQ